MPLRTPGKQAGIKDFFFKSSPSVAQVSSPAVAHSAPIAIPPKKSNIEVVIYQKSTPPSQKTSAKSSPAESESDDEPIIRSTTRIRRSESVSSASTPMTEVSGRGRIRKKARAVVEEIDLSNDDDEDDMSDNASIFGSDDATMTSESESDSEVAQSDAEDSGEEEGIKSAGSDSEEDARPAKRRKMSPPPRKAGPGQSRVAKPKVSAAAQKALAKGNYKKLVHKNLGADYQLYPELENGEEMDVNSEPSSEDDEVIDDDEEPKTKPAKKKASANAANAKADSWAHKMGLAQDLKPMHRIAEIFDDMTERAIKRMEKLHNPKNQKLKELTNYDSSDKNTLVDLIRHLNGRKLRMATMCSGTESPVLALEQVSNALRDRGLNFEIDHQFSAEIVPYKQAYIERNFSPPIIFRDIKELSIPGATHATTAYGARAKIPDDIDILVTGFSCVDFSGLNTSKKNMEQFGESGDTFFAMRDYARVYRPKIIILENVVGAPWMKIGNYMAAIGYSCKHQVVDTKDYYIPHTRQRGYMMCVDMYDYVKKDKRSAHEKKLIKNLQFSEYMDKFYEEASLNTYARRMKNFERPASSSVEAFLLDVDDPRVVAGRAELSTNSRSENKRVVDWTRCQGRHEDYRFNHGLGPRRYLTSWEDGGTMNPRDNWWPDWWKSQVERIWDHAEMSWLRGLNRGYDIEYKFRIIDFSQNIDRGQDTGGAGLTGCVTPTGIAYSTMRGGPLIGLEALSLQGLPIELLQLTREPQAHIKDLAGNAMSTTVVGAAMLAALTARYHVFERGDGIKKVEAKSDVKKTILDPECEHFTMGFAAKSTMTVDEAIKAANETFRACYCEDRFSMATAPLRKCVACGHTTCTDCGNSPKHEYALWSPERLPPGHFEAQLKAALPMKVMLDNIDITHVRAAREESEVAFTEDDMKLFKKLDGPIEKALKSELRFHSLRRMEIWTATYESTFARLELIFFESEVEWRLFAKPDAELASNSPIRLALERPIARIRPNGKYLTDGNWQIWLHKPMKIVGSVEGLGEPVPSFKNVVGLMAQSNEYQFPQQKVSFDDNASEVLDVNLAGVYDWHQDCGMSHGSLHVKHQGNPAAKKVFLFHDPHRINDPKDDPFVFSYDKRRLQYNEVRPLLARVDQEHARWELLKFDIKAGMEPGTARLNEKVVSIDECRKPHKMTLIVDGKWLATDIGFSSAHALSSGNFLRAPENFDIVPADDCDESHVLLQCDAILPDGEMSRYHKGRWLDVGPLEYREFFSEFAWLTEKVRHIPGVDKWRKYKDSKVSHCHTCAPAPPDMKWKLDEKNKLVPFEDPKTAGAFENQLKDRPPPLVTEVLADKGTVSLKMGFNPQTLVHRAAAKLGLGEKKLDWRLITDYNEPPKMEFPEFMLMNNDEDSGADRPRDFKMNLRPEQRRSLHWMLSREEDDVEPFIEEEVEEFSIPLLGWRAEGRARKEKLVRGGVLADQVGFGKTVTTLALINSRHAADREQAKEDVNGFINIKASLVLVPKQLPEQWNKEVTKFIRAKLSVIQLKNPPDVAKYTVQDFIDSDVIIASWRIIDNESYLFKLAQFAGVVELPEKAPHRAKAAWYANAMKKIGENVEVLKNDPESLHQHIKDNLESEGGIAAEAETYVPSKRLRGQAYQDYKAKLRLQEERRGIHEDLFGGDAPAQTIKEDKDGGKQVKFTGNVRPDVFQLAKVSKLGSKNVLRGPIFEIFRFSRVVVDEYAYVAGEQSLTIAGLNARAKWILSGTPPLQDFLDVKRMSNMLGINLGIDDFTTGVMNAQNIKLLTKDMTSGEEFRTFKQKQSFAWHQNRHQLAQRFLNTFVRQNIADIEAIDGATHHIPITLPAAERAIYIELQQLLAASDFKMVKGKRGLENHRMKRIRELLGASEDVNEALMKCASYFDLDKSEKGKAAKDATSAIVEIRDKQLHTLQGDIANVLKQAEYLSLVCEDPCDQYDALIRQVAHNHFGDVATCADVTKMQEFAHDNRKTKHWKQFYTTEEQQRQYDIDYPKEKKGKAATKKRKRGGSYDDEDEDLDLNEGEESEADNKPQKFPLLPEGRRGNVEYAHTALRDVTNTLRKSVVEYVARQRCLRFFHAIQVLQKFAKTVRSDTEPTEDIKCSACEACFDPGEVFVLSGCGHVACETCLDTHQRTNLNNISLFEECLISGCKAVNKSFQIIPVNDLMIEEAENRTGRHYGKKIEDIIDLIKKIPKDEQVLLFVQFPDLLAKMCRAFRERGVTHLSLDMDDPAKILSRFQEDTGDKAMKVLVLNIGDASAAGSNLTNANHVIFLSPYLTDREQTYRAGMTQAIGRARRYGQTKVVHTYHFLALKTIDVDVFEANNHCIVDTNVERQKFVPYEGFYKDRRVVGVRPDRVEGRLQQSVFGSTVANLNMSLREE